MKLLHNPQTDWIKLSFLSDLVWVSPASSYEHHAYKITFGISDQNDGYYVYNNGIWKQILDKDGKAVT